MSTSYKSHPAIGVARLGNSPDEFYLAPETIGGRPIACDASGNPLHDNGNVKFVDQYKDSVGRIKRQATKFRVLEHSDDGSKAVELGHDEIKKIV